MHSKGAMCTAFRNPRLEKQQDWGIGVGCGLRDLTNQQWLTEVTEWLPNQSVRIGAGEMALQLSAFISLSQNRSLVPRTRVWQITNHLYSSSRGSHVLLDTCTFMHVSPHGHAIYTSSKIILKNLILLKVKYISGLARKPQLGCSYIMYQRHALLSSWFPFTGAQDNGLFSWPHKGRNKWPSTLSQEAQQKLRRGFKEKESEPKHKSPQYRCYTLPCITASTTSSSSVVCRTFCGKLFIGDIYWLSLKSQWLKLGCHKCVSDNQLHDN